MRDSRSRGGSDERDSDVLTTGDSPRTRLSCFGLGALAGPSGEFAVGEGRASADQGDEVRCVDGAPAGRPALIR